MSPLSADLSAELRRVRTLTIIKPSSLGDIVHALPAVHLMRQQLPEVQIHWLANTEWLPLLEGGWLDHCEPFPRRQFKGVRGLCRLPGWLRHWRRVPRPGPEWVLDFQGLARSGLLARCRGAERVVGLSDAREGAHLCHHLSVRVDRDAHAVDRYLELPRFLGLEVPPPAEIRFPLPAGVLPQSWPAGVRPIVVHPFSRGAGKALPQEVLVALLEALRGHPTVLVGVGDCGQLPDLPLLTNLSHQTSLPQLIACLQAAAAVISVDSGPMHLAAAVNPRCIGIHTWTDPRKVGPYPPQTWVWKAGRIAPRAAFSALENETSQMVTPADAGVIAAAALELAARSDQIADRRY
jgi:heptosyltransferase-1